VWKIKPANSQLLVHAKYSVLHSTVL